MKDSNNKVHIAAVVVTYNRKQLLVDCLNALLNQSYAIEKLMIIDNASTDGTREILEEKGYLKNPIVLYNRMECNLGGAGGFYEGFKRAIDLECDWVWVMDDDTIPQKDCLKNLVQAYKCVCRNSEENKNRYNRKPSFFASAIYGPQGEYMNVPTISEKPSSNGYAYWYQYLKDGIVSISRATFVSVMFSLNAIKNCGLPCKEYFIWGDDMEYTLRLSTYYGDGYFVGNSVAIHNRTSAKKLEMKNENNAQRIDMFHYLYRNQSINRRYYKYDYKGLAFELMRGLAQVLKSCRIKPYPIRRGKAILRGYFEAVVQYKNFKHYIDNECGLFNK